MQGPIAHADGVAVSAEDISKTYGRTEVLSRVSLTVRKGEIHALVGGNGSGKSTLVKVIAGVISSDPGGKISARGRTVSVDDWTPHEARRAHIRFVHQDLGLFGDMTVADNLCVGTGFEKGTFGRIRWGSVKARSRDLLRRHGLDIDPRRQLRELTLAEQSMVAIARALHDVETDDSACVVLDEPTAALPRGDRTHLLRTLRNLADAGHGVLLVTHHIDEVLEASDRVTVLHDGAHVQTSSTDELTRRGLIELIVGTAAPLDHAPRGHSDRERGATTPALSLRSVRAGRATSVSLDVFPGEIVGLAGLPSAGCEDVARALFGLVRVTGGAILLNGADYHPGNPTKAMTRGIAFLPGDRLRDGVFADLSLLNNVTAASTSSAGRWRLHHRAERARALDLLQSFRVRPADPARPIDTLSGGNQQKVLLARWGCREPRLLLLEDPTRGVDVGARSEIWRLLRAAAADGTTIVVTSTDLDELAWYCDRAVVMGNGRVHSHVAGADLTPARLTNEIYEANDMELEVL